MFNHTEPISDIYASYLMHQSWILSKPVKHTLYKNSVIREMEKKSLKLFFARTEGNIIPLSRCYIYINWFSISGNFRRNFKILFNITLVSLMLRLHSEKKGNSVYKTEFIQNGFFQWFPTMQTKSCMIQIMALIISRDLQRLFKGLYFSFVASHRGHENSLKRTKRKLLFCFIFL